MTADRSGEPTAADRERAYRDAQDADRSLTDTLAGLGYEHSATYACGPGEHLFPGQHVITWQGAEVFRGRAWAVWAWLRDGEGDEG